MIILLDEDFKRLIQKKDSYVELGPAVIDDIDYPSQYLYDRGVLQIFLDLSDEGELRLINSPRVTFKYTNLLTNEVGTSFVVEENIGNIQLLSGKNLFEISGLENLWFANFKLNQDDQVKFLESPGNGIGGSLYKDDFKFTTIKSYYLYLQEIQSFDNLDHLQTVYYNNFGIRTY